MTMNRRKLYKYKSFALIWMKGEEGKTGERYPSWCFIHHLFGLDVGLILGTFAD